MKEFRKQFPEEGRSEKSGLVTYENHSIWNILKIKTTKQYNLQIECLK